MSDWFDVHKIDDYTYSICEHGHWERMNSFLLNGSTHALLIDTGLGIGNIKEVVDGLTGLPVIVATTHVHWDHIGGHGLFDDIYVHEAEAGWLRNGIPLPINVIRSLIMKEEFYRKPPEGFDLASYSVYTGEPTAILRDGDIIDLGGRQIAAIHTPGHSPGHTCYFDLSRGYLFSGDLIYSGTLYCNYPSTDPILFKKSIDRVCTMGEMKRIFPAHNEINISLDIAYEIKRAFETIENRGLLKHGSGTFNFDGFEISL